MSRYVICNDTTHPIRFGQALTDEDILLGSRQCHFYSWRTHRVKEVLRVGVEEGAWVWSQPFSIDVDGLQLCSLADCGMQDVSIVVKVSSLSVTQKQVCVSIEDILLIADLILFLHCFHVVSYHHIISFLFNKNQHTLYI